MANFLSSRWFLVGKGSLLALIAFLLQQETAAEAAKAAGEIVTTWDIPNAVIPVLGMLYGLAQSGQKK